MTTKKPHKGGRVPGYSERVASGKHRLEVWLDEADWQTIVDCARDEGDGSRAEALRIMIALYRGVREEERLAKTK